MSLFFVQNLLLNPQKSHKRGSHFACIHAVYVVSQDIFMHFGLLICFQNRFRNDFDIPLLNFELNVDLIGILHTYPSTLPIRNLYPVLHSDKVLEFLFWHFFLLIYIKMWFENYKNTTKIQIFIIFKMCLPT